MAAGSCGHKRALSQVNEETTGTMEKKFSLFGQFLLEKGLVTFDDIYYARMLQKNENLKLDELALNKGWLTEEQIRRIAVFQEESDKAFIETAVEKGFLKGTQVDVLLKGQSETYLFFGEALVRLGTLSKEVLFESLKEFNNKLLKRRTVDR